MQNAIWNDQNTSSTAYPPRQSPIVAQGWECPRCGAINAPWVSQCQCAKRQFTITCTDGLSQAQCDSETFKIHPDSTIYQVGGSDYKEGNTYVNVGGTQSNKVDSNVTAWSCTNPNIAINDFTTYRTDVPKTYTKGE